MLPSILAREIIRGLQAYIETGYETRTPRFSGAFRALVREPGRFFKGPYLSLDLPFRPGQKSQDFFNGFQTAFPPYLHQQQAWQRLASDRQAKSTLIATGTGSGKTECFLYPLLDHCLRHSGKGIKAIIIYPMNALATDQAKRFAEVIHQSPTMQGRIRVGLFVGGLEDHPSKSMSGDKVITDKAVLREDPPDILLTNYKMLDFLLLRPRDQALWRFNGTDTLRYLVVDELHTFDGAQGTDLACLVRRLKARLLPEDREKLICVGTSATLGDGGQGGELRDYAARVFQAEFDAQSIIGETRQSAGEFLDKPIKYMLSLPAEADSILEFSRYASIKDYLAAQYGLFFPDQGAAVPDDPVWQRELGEALREHLLFNNLLRILGQGPKDLTQITEEFCSTLPKGKARELAQPLLDSLCALIANARDATGRPLVNLRFQLWVRELRRMVAPVLPPAEGALPGLEFSDDLRVADAGIHLPLVQCNQCHATAWLTSKLQSSQQVETELKTIYNHFFRQQPEVRVLLPLMPREKAPDTQGYTAWLCGHCGQLQTSDGDCLACGEVEPQPVFVPNLIRSKKSKGYERLVSERNCPVCGQKDALLIFGARATSLSSVAIHHDFATPFNDDKKLIAFSDSVQDAAHRAGFFAARTWQNNVRMAVAQALPEAPLSLPEFTRHLSRFWRDPGLNAKAMSEKAFIVEFIAPNMQYFSDYIELESSGELPPESHLLEEVEKRLAWEVLAEFGYRSRIGRSLERTGVAALGVDMDAVDKAASAVLIPLQEQDGLKSVTRQELRWFMLGLLLRLKQRGAIIHPVLEGYVAKGCDTWVLNRKAWLPDFHALSARPVFLLEGAAEAGFDGLINRKGKSWYQHWFYRVLDADQLLPDGIEQSVYTRVLQALETVGLLRAFSYKDKTVWGLNPDLLYISRKGVRLQSQESRDVLFVAQDMADELQDMPSMDLVDQGQYQKTSSGVSWLANLYRNGEIRRVIAREHTGLLERETREALERDFKQGDQPWKPNLLSATPTLEMGIDIGDLSSLLLCSVPPSQANYLQRIGRAGRKDGNAFTLTLAAGAPHDLYFYADPLQMMAGRVESPGVFLNATAVISRQLTAYCLDRWVQGGIAEDAIPRTLKPVLDSVEINQIHRFPYNFLSFVKQHALALLDDFFALFEGELSAHTRTCLREFILGEGAADGLEMRLIKRLQEMVRERAGFRKQIDQLKRHLDKLCKQPGDEALRQEMEEVQQERAALQAMLRRMNALQPLNFLTDEGVIPNYAFPEEGVTLRSVIYRRKKAGEETSFENLVYEYERPGASAISELVPKSSFYAGGRKVMISQVDMKLSTLESWRFCPSCSFSRLEIGEEILDACPRCGDRMWADTGQKASMLRLRQVMANTSDPASRIGDDSDDRENRFYNKQMLVDVPSQGVGPAYRLDEEGLPFGFEFVRNATFREINFGEFGQGAAKHVAGEELARSGFSLCRHCGYVQGKQNGKQPHAYTCPARKKDPEDEKHFIDCLYLYREFSSEALRILLPIVLLEGVEQPLSSFIAALQLGLKLKFGGKVDHLRVTTYSEPAPDGEGRRRYLMLYDSVPGGTGYLQDLMKSPESLMGVFEKSYAAMTGCSCNQDAEKDGCYRCLFAYRNSYGMESTSRTTAVEMLGSLLARKDSLHAIDTIDEIVLNPAFDSELESLFIGALVKTRADEIKIRQQVVNGKSAWFLTVGSNYYTIEPQVLLGDKQGVALASKPDFLIRKVNATDAEYFKPIAVFLDGFRYHRDSVDDDSAKRLAILRSGGFRVWSLTWDDISAYQAGDTHTPNPFAEQLNSGMKPLQDRLLQLFGISQLFKSALFSPMEILLSYLSDPNDQDWMNLAFVRLLGWFDTQVMQESTFIREVRGRLEQRAPAVFLQALEATGEAAYGAYHKDESDELSIDCVIPLEAIQQKNAAGILCSIWLDDQRSDAKNFKSNWQAFIKAANLLQFLPLCGWFTFKGIKSGIYESLDFSCQRTSATADQSEYGALLEEALEDYRDALEIWLDKGGMLPVMGFELVGEQDAVVAEGELAWPEQKIICLMEEEMAYRSVFEENGWQVVLLDTESQWLDSQLLAELREH